MEQKSLSRAPIGVFDSGIGGLTVVRELMRQMPEEKIVYFGDTAHLPYGSKSKSTVIHFSKQIVGFLKEQHVKAIVIACNTASALALDEVKECADVPVIGVISPAVKMAALATQSGRIGVIATQATIESDVYSRQLRENNPDYRVFGKACPLFVPLVEEGWTHDSVTEEVARRYLKDLQHKDIDTLILGCTHYPLLRTLLRKITGDEMVLVNPAYETAVELKKMLERMELSGSNYADSWDKYQFFVSDAAEKFQEFAASILPCEIRDTRQLSLEHI